MDSKNSSDCQIGLGLRPRPIWQSSEFFSSNYFQIGQHVVLLHIQTKRRSIFSYLKDQRANVYFLQETYSVSADENMWKNEWGGKIFFSHGTNHSKGVCTLINPPVNYQIDYSYANTSGRIILVTIVLGSQNISLCNIYAPNNQSHQLEFMQELNNCIIDKTELTALIEGGDWNCTLSRKDKIGGTPWKPSNYSNLVLTTMDMFDLVDIQRVRHPKALQAYVRVKKSKDEIET